MATIDEILGEIRRNTGIVRTPVRLNDVNTALATFTRVADAMLEWKGSRFNLEAVRTEVLALVNWTYMLDDSLDYTKGILFKGRTGAGKTFLFSVWRQFLRVDGLRFISNGSTYPLSPVIANSRNVASLFAESAHGGGDVIRHFSTIPCLVLDDIGAEPEVQSSFGNRTNVIAEIIDRRNEGNLLTFGTTNLNKMSEAGAYDDRTVRRMGELFNVIPVKDGYNSKTTRNEN